MSARTRFCLVGSSGGHLTQLLALRPLWEDVEHCWVTFPTQDARSLLRAERTYWSAYPTTRNARNLLRNFVVAWRVLRREKPQAVISTGAAVAIPFFLLGKLLGCKLIYLEVYDRVDTPTWTGRVCYRLAHVFALQWETQRRFYPRGVLIGPVL